MLKAEVGFGPAAEQRKEPGARHEDYSPGIWDEKKHGDIW
jgi:hypothetical protein